jgi:nucleotide-binding universal stress UspA family protein
MKTAADRAGERMEEYLEREAPGRRVEVHVRQSEHAAEAIVEESGRLGSEVIVMATHGWSGLPHMLLGSVTEKVVRTAPVPVLSVRVPARMLRPARS